MEIHVAFHEGAHRCYRTTNGIDREYFGPRFGGPRLAGQYADLAAGRPISPLRHPVTRSTEEPSGAVPPWSGSPAAVIPPASSRA